MRKQLKLDAKCLNGFVDSDDFEVIKPEVEEAYKCLMERSGKGKEFLGWLEVDRIASEVLLEDIENTAKKMIAMSEAIVVIGVGGSYLGAKAVIKALSPKTLKDKIFFAGQNISGEYISGLLGVLKDKDISVIVISKSGTTTETAIAFRIIEDFLEEKYDQTEVAKRIICITDKEKGALRNIAEEKGLKSFIIPEDVGGRFSILTPVGLLPAACAGIDIRELVSGAVFQ
ncbi:MAG: glucose-6-phosphate isomerase, partial [Candidatus Omnitrophica bacterium]|nr:glucose-6-phosphate isomerase [Candidatus Omnitrophota bacterium]